MFTSSFINTYSSADIENELLFPLLEKEVPLEEISDYLENNLMVDDFYNYRSSINKSLLLKIANDFVAEYSAKKNYFTDVALIALQSIFIHSISVILKQSPDFIGIELTASKSIFIVTKFGAITVHIELFLRDSSSPEALTVINVYHDKEHVLADSGSFSAAIISLKEFLPKQTTIFFNRIPLNYVVSRSASAEFTI